MSREISASVEHGTLDALITKMPIPTGASAPRVWLMSQRAQPPYGAPADPFGESPIIVRQIPGTFVGIGRVVEAPSHDLLCADSFAPSVPVIVLKGDTAILAHCNGTSRARDIANLRAGGTVIVVRKKHQYRQAAVADAIIQILESGAPPVQHCDVGVVGPLGVLVYGQTATVIIYPQV
ncbi:hypothetical protein A7982_12382 [Minicystis rosea]|nr:hypothetical protein A7982_12382 [Minicystis rosea]